MMNRVLGLGVSRPAAEEELDAALAAVPPGPTYYVAVEPDARPEELGSWLKARGLEPGWGWMRFHRGLDVPPAPSSDLRLECVASDGLLAAFATIVRVGYELPEAVEHALRRAAD